MFYQESQISSYLNCKKCNERLDEPKLLPCGFNLCNSCSSSLKLNNDKQSFECPLCSKTHNLPSEGLPTVKALHEILALKPNEVHRSDNVNLLKHSLNDLNEKIEHISNGLRNGVELIKDHCIDLRAELQLATELTIQQINEFNAFFLSRINQYETECIAQFEASEKRKSEFEELLAKMKEFYTRMSAYLKEFNIEDFIIIEANENVRELRKKAENYSQKLDDLIYNNNYLKFVRNKSKLDETILGELSRPVVVQLSILSNQQMMDLMKVCEFPLNQKWKLLYRASRDGFSAADFHSRCDDKKNTLTIIKTTSGCVFGGFTEKDWSGNEVDKYDANAFIFSFINKEDKPMKIKCKSPSYAIYCSSGCGPVFGTGHDIYVCNNSNTNFGSYSIPESYPIKSDTFLAGSNDFLVADIEVYSKE